MKHNLLNRHCSAHEGHHRHCNWLKPEQWCDEAGLTLVEMMVAIVISMLLTVAIGGIYLGSKSSFRYQDALSRVQENARFAMERLSRDIRMAGYNGCGNLPNVNVANTVNNWTKNPWVDLSNPVMGYEGGVSAFPAEFPGAVPGTDAIILKGADTSNELTVIKYYKSTGQIDTTVNTIQAGEILIITDSDCSQTSIFQMTGPASASHTNIVHDTGTGVPGNCTKDLGASCPGSMPHQFQPGSSLLPMYANGYYIKPSATADGGNSLWMISLTGQTIGRPTDATDTELINGVENMQIEYGVDTDDTDNNIYGLSANKYVKANSVTDWSKVVSVKVSLLLATPDNLSSKSQTYTYNGTTTTATDRRVRHVYTSVINLRNRTK
jgi:type IV pilus assembly protein PilW